MEDDDEFGDLYTDVLRPLTASIEARRQDTDSPVASSSAPPPPPPSSHSRPIDLNINSDDEEILYGASDLKNSKSDVGFNLNAPVQEETLTQSDVGPEPRKFDLNLNLNPTPESARVEGTAGNGGRGSEIEARVLEKLPQKANFMEDDDDLDIVVEERDNKEDDLIQEDNIFIIDNKDNMYNSADQKEENLNFVNETEMGSDKIIPGLSGRSENLEGSNFEEEWESDESEDDLQIVLNDNNHGMMGTERMPGVDDEDDEDGEQLVILADNGDAGHHQQMMEEQEWGGESGGPAADGDRKELGDASKASGGVGIAVQAAVQPKVGYGNHAYHHPFHSQFKYVRPGVALMPGAAPVTSGGIPSQVRPPVTMGPVAGRGRGDWRPTGLKGAVPMQKGFNPGYGMPVWGGNSAGRGYGSGLDFTLPSHKTIFEVDIDSFEEKPWKLPGTDISDFFNFGLNEDSWKDYCKQLEQLRLETTMQSKIRVYESGRAEQDYDPDLPPELAAAVGMQEIPSQSANSGKVDAGPTESARASAHERPPLPIGRPIPVEASSGERPPSVDTRRPRMHDIDTIIEVSCHNSTDDDDMAEQQDKDPAGKDLEGGDEIDDLQQDDTEHIDRISHAYNGQKKELVARRHGVDEIVRKDVSHFPPERSPQYQPDGEVGVPHNTRSTKGKGRVRSPKMTTSGIKRDEEIMDEQSFDSGSGKQSPPLPSSRAIGSDGEQTVDVRDDTNDDSAIGDRSFDMEREEMPVDETAGDALEDGSLMHSTKRQKLSSHVDQLSQDNDDEEDSKAARSSENSKARSGSSKDHQEFRDSVEAEVFQDRHPPRAGNMKRPVGDEDNARRKGRHGREETGRRHMSVTGREESYSRRGGDPNSSLRRHMISENADWRKESDVSEGSWHWRDEGHHGRRNRVEDTRNTELGGEIGSRYRGKVRESGRSEKEEYHQSRNQLDNGSWRAAKHGQDMGSRQRGRDDNIKNQNEKMDDLQSKKRKEEAHISREHVSKEDISHNHRESSSRRKRERDDVSDQRKRDGQARLKDDDVHFGRQKEEGSFQRERNDRQRERDEWHRLKQSHEEILSRREREETRPVFRSGRAPEDKVWISNSRGKDEYRGSSREYHPKDINRHSDQTKKRDRVENETFSHHRGHEEIYARSNKLSHDEKRVRYERSDTRNERVPHASEASRVHELKQKESSRKGKDSESGDHSSLVPSKRKQDEHGGQISETVNLRGRTERESGENEIHVAHQSSKNLKQEASSEDEQLDSRKGRSKLERWASHKETDLKVASMSSSSLKSKKLDTITNSGAPSVTRLPEEPSRRVVVEDKPQPLVDNDKDNTGAETNNVNPKVMEDTVAKLKKRSERFKLPMPSEKDTTAIKKMESEPLTSVQTEIPPDSEIKPERPARKRRWTGN
ncbi:hypothetical protein ACJIZ3_020647 [Penstemon smallii]|uniref:Pre-mRNA polyadenylation factor Fip1 domain-containing protein n=1 Tax=Penstemon smallii TaxID=265156 RepID=A0ABD3SJG1_9LAMI